ncbi:MULTISPECIES: glycine zipper domain-containing protein [unclassified Thioalkalivibrio]|uniref:YMGG-like glycine zipper-containing protein n=1 Tax=unclassified Thioalkalivibrio TaxID=2621013 RepID=UPI0001959C1B|nr:MULTISPECIES: glycine zipper domain-containing protein [unclassified Thioalkalivibrio]ADC72779.1 17 kDa surface antigen [Thioalkalivibrio sp. K90mix]
MARKRNHSRRGVPTHLKALAAAMLFGFAADTLAAPPPWAPAHGWRAQNDPGYAGYHGYSVDRWEHDYGVMDGRCNRDAIGAAIGGGAGAVIGHQVGDGDPVAILIGAAGGAVLGGMIGRQMDRNDQACMGHALELAEPGQPVYWDNANGQPVHMTPGRVRDSGCRDFEMMIDGERHTGTACPDEPGHWEIRG